MKDTQLAHIGGIEMKDTQLTELRKTMKNTTLALILAASLPVIGHAELHSVTIEKAEPNYDAALAAVEARQEVSDAAYAEGNHMSIYVGVSPRLRNAKQFATTICYILSYSAVGDIGVHLLDNTSRDYNEVASTFCSGY